MNLGVSSLVKNSSFFQPPWQYICSSCFHAFRQKFYLFAPFLLDCEQSLFCSRIRAGRTAKSRGRYSSREPRVAWAGEQTRDCSQSTFLLSNLFQIFRFCQKCSLRVVRPAVKTVRIHQSEAKTWPTEKREQIQRLQST